MNENPTRYFIRKIAGLIVQGKFQRAAREVARWNSDKTQKLRLFSSHAEQLKWANITLAEKAEKKEELITLI